MDSMGGQRCKHFAHWIIDNTDKQIHFVAWSVWVMWTYQWSMLLVKSRTFFMLQIEIWCRFILRRYGSQIFYVRSPWAICTFQDYYVKYEVNVKYLNNSEIGRREILPEKLFSLVCVFLRHILSPYSFTEIFKMRNFRDVRTRSHDGWLVHATKMPQQWFNWTDRCLNLGAWLQRARK